MTRLFSALIFIALPFVEPIIRGLVLTGSVWGQVLGGGRP